MRCGKETACVGAGMAFCVILGGCVGFGDRPMTGGRDARGIRPQQVVVVPDLRIQGEVRASGSDVPIVPLPIPPSERITAPPPKTVVQVSNPPPAPRSSEPSPSPLPSAMNDPAPMPQTVMTGIDNIRRIHRLAAERYDSMDSYIARLTRREQVRGENKPEEVMLFKFRKEPWSVYFKWLGPVGRGREVIYVKGQYEDKIQTLLASGDMPLAPAGKRMALAPDSFFVRSASRHPITEAGLGASIVRLGQVLTALERGDQRFGTLTDLGLVIRPEFGRAVPAVEHLVPPGFDPALPKGGRRWYFFDADSFLPVLLTTRDPSNQEVEYYYYDRLQFPVRLDNNDFNPDKLWDRPPR